MYIFNENGILKYEATLKEARQHFFMVSSHTPKNTKKYCIAVLATDCIDKAIPQKPNLVSGVKYCSKCGCPVSDEMNYCYHCGQAILREEISHENCQK